jgi:uncharacterized protein YecT (DUF1311 family)
MESKSVRTKAMSLATLVALAVQFLAASLSAQDGQLRSAVDDWVRSRAAETTAFRHAFTDLDGDGRVDAVVVLRGSAWCGSGGCTMLVLRGTSTGFSLVSSTTLISEPIRVSPQKTFGWKNLIVNVKTVGNVVLPFNGKSYPEHANGQSVTAAQSKAAEILIEPCCVSLYTSEVRYDSFSEPGSVKLQDGQNLRISFRSIGGLVKPDVEEWTPGKQLLVIYSSDEGAGLLDPKTLKSAAILDGLEKHPINALVDKCLQSEAQTTGEMVACGNKGLAMWDNELNRFYRQLTASLGQTQKQSVQTAQREWLQYRDAMRAALDATDNDGTLSRVSRAMEAMRVTKEQAERLARVLAR